MCKYYDVDYGSCDFAAECDNQVGYWQGLTLADQVVCPNCPGPQNTFAPQQKHPQEKEVSNETDE